MAINMNEDGTASGFLIKRPQDGIERYIAERENFFRMINEKAVAAGREPQFLDIKLAARIYEVVELPKGGYQLKRRERPLLNVDDDLRGNNTLAANMAKTLGEHKGIDKMRGKYNDNAILIMGEEENFSKSEMMDIGSWH